MVHRLLSGPPSEPVLGLLGVDAPPAEFSSHLEGEFSATRADRRGLAQNSIVDGDEQVFVRLVLNLDGDILVVVLSDPEYSLDFGAGPNLDNLAGEASKLAFLECED